jgi:hypothetical protein
LREFEEIEILRQCCTGDCEWQGGKLFRLLSGFYPRIRPLDISDLNHIMLIANAAAVDSGLQLDISAQVLFKLPSQKKNSAPFLSSGWKVKFILQKINQIFLGNISHRLCSENAL